MLVPIQKADLGDDTRSIVNPDVNIEQRTAEKSGERNVTTSTNLNPSNRVLAPGEDIPLRIDFDGTVTGATQNDLTVYGGTIVSFSISSDMIDVTIRPDSQNPSIRILSSTWQRMRWIRATRRGGLSWISAQSDREGKARGVCCIDVTLPR